MVLELLLDKRHLHKGETMVSLNIKLRRLVLYKSSLDLMKEKYGQEFDHVLIFFDSEVPNCFWLRPASADEHGSRKLSPASQSCRMLSISLLIGKLGLKGEETQKLPLEWDEKNSSAKITVVTG
jgi:hypothetical protein